MSCHVDRVDERTMSEMRALMHTHATDDERAAVATMTDEQVLKSYDVAYPGGVRGFVDDNKA